MNKYQNYMNHNVCIMFKKIGVTVTPINYNTKPHHYLFVFFLPYQLVFL